MAATVVAAAFQDAGREWGLGLGRNGEGRSGNAGGKINGEERGEGSSTATC
jgi:hypothetical protein